MYRYPAAATLAFGLAVLGACAQEPKADEELGRDTLEKPTVEKEPVDRSTGAGGRVVMTANFQPGEGAKEGQDIKGTVTVLESAPGGDARLEVRLQGLPAGEHAWHIHGAACGREAPIVVPFTATKDAPGLAQPLTPRADGAVEVNVTVPKDKLSIEQLEKGGYSLHVHEKGGVEPGPGLVCANL